MQQAEANRSCGEDVEELLAEFCEILQESTSVPSFAPFLERCSDVDQQEELVSLMNTLVLAEQALAPIRDTTLDVADVVDAGIDRVPDFSRFQDEAPEPPISLVVSAHHGH